MLHNHPFPNEANASNIQYSKIRTVSILKQYLFRNWRPALQ